MFLAAWPFPPHKPASIPPVTLAVVLVSPKTPGNIGSAARAMLNMGARDLRLVAPRCDHLDSGALAMAVHAADLLRGATLYPTLRDGFDGFAAAVEQVAVARQRQAVRISATSAFTTWWLLPRVQRFQAAHPDVDLQVHASDDVVDMRAAQTDLAVRYGRGPYPGLRATVMLADQFAPVANPSLSLSSAADLRRAPLIHFGWRRVDPANPTWDAWFKAAGLPAAPVPHLLFSEEGHAIQAAVAGQGVALLSLVLVHGEIEAGRLVQPFGPVLDSYAYHLVEAADRPVSKAAQVANLTVS